MATASANAVLSRMQLLGLQWVSSRLQCVLLEFAEAFNLRILTAKQFAAGMVAAAPHSMNVITLGGAVGGLMISHSRHAPVAACMLCSPSFTSRAWNCHDLLSTPPSQPARAHGF